MLVVRELRLNRFYVCLEAIMATSDPTYFKLRKLKSNVYGELHEQKIIYVSYFMFYLVYVRARVTTKIAKSKFCLPPTGARLCVCIWMDEYIRSLCFIGSADI